MEKNFCLCCDDKYVPFAAVTIKSILNHVNDGDNVRIHIFTTGIKESNKIFLENLSKSIKVYPPMPIAKLPIRSMWPAAAWLRIYVEDFLDEKIDRVLYLDCDVILNDSCDELFTMDMTGKSVAGCLDINTYNEEHRKLLGMPSSAVYISSGVLMINLDYWRAKCLKKRIIEFGISCEKLIWPDQDSINHVCHDSMIVLKPDYGVLVMYFTCKEFYSANKDCIERLFRSPKIIHYAGYSPWVYCKNRSAHSAIWWRYYRELHSFPHVRQEYHKGKLKWWTRILLTKLGIFRRGHRLSVKGESFYHPRITEKRVMELINGVNEK